MSHWSCDTVNDIVTNHVTEFDDVTLQNDEYNFWLYEHEHPIYPYIFPIYLFLIAVEINIGLYSIWF